jgi:D-3-phosphoglycerate dehydrogenase
MPSVDAKTLQVLQPYITLGQRLGSLAAQLAGGQVAEVRVTYVGEVANYDTSSVTLAILKGLLEPMVGESVNYVNASLIAAERGLKVIEAKANRMDEFANLMALDVRSNGSTLTLQGTLSARREPRIVKIDRYFVEAAPEGYMLIIKNQDKPGLIGQLGTLLGEAKINIAGMSNGRDEPGGNAITVVNIDNPVPPAVLERVKKLKHVIDAKLITP